MDNGWGPKVEDAISGAAQRHGLAPTLLRAFAKIESSGRPTAQTGSYKGLFQLSNSEFGKYGGGDIFNPADNANAAAQKLARESATFKAKYGRDPSPSDLYLIHQQGEGGYGAHVANPSAPAWQNMHSTAEGRQKGPEWAKQAIWGNVPADVRSQYPGGVDSLTSQQFLDLWRDKVTRMGSSMPATRRSTLTESMGAGFLPGMTLGHGQTIGEMQLNSPQPQPAAMPDLSPPSGRKSRLAEMLMSQAIGARPRGWGDALNALGSMVAAQGLYDQADREKKEYGSKLATALGGASTPEALTRTLIASGDPELQRAGISAKIEEAKAQRPLRGKDRYMLSPAGQIVDLETMQPLPGIGPKPGADDTMQVNGRVITRQPDGSYKEVYNAPPKLEAADRKEIFEADEGVEAGRNVMSALDRAIELNKTAYQGPTAQTRGYISSLFGSTEGANTEELQNVVTQQVLDNLKATFGAAPTEGERQILVDVQGSVNKASDVRAKIFQNAKAAAQKRIRFNSQKAEALRSGGYYQPGYSPAQPGVGAPQASPRRNISTPPLPGARQADDGNWYVEQNGRFFRVD